MDGCLACDLIKGRVPLPGGLIYSEAGWRVEHCIGQLPVGTLILKPERHVTAVAGLGNSEAAALGPLLRKTSEIAGLLTNTDQVYNCLWSHSGGTPVHIHYVIQPVTRADFEEFGMTGPDLQSAMFAAGRFPDPAAMEAAAEQARQMFKS